MSRKQWFGLIRLLLSLAVAAWAINLVVSKAGVGDPVQELLHSDWRWLGLSIFLTGSATAISSYRWSCLLALQQVVITQWDAFRLTMIGVFFNLFGLGGVGGDVFKMYYVTEQAGDRKEEAVLSIVVDRIVGLLGLFVVALATLPFVWNELRTAPASIQSMAGFVVLISLVGGGGVTVVMSRDLWLPASAKEGLRKLSVKFPAKLVRLFVRLVRSLDLYREQLPQLFKALALSSICHSMATLGVFCVGQAFSVQGLSLRNYFLGVQVANTISAVPITPSGLGSRDLVLSEFFKFGGADSRYGLIPFGVSAIIVLWSLVGGIFFVAARRSGTTPKLEGESQT